MHNYFALTCDRRSLGLIGTRARHAREKFRLPPRFASLVPTTGGDNEHGMMAWNLEGIRHCVYPPSKCPPDDVSQPASAVRWRNRKTPQTYVMYGQRPPASSAFSVKTSAGGSVSSLTNGFSNPLVCWNFCETAAKSVLRGRRCLRRPPVSARERQRTSGRLQ